MSYLDNYRSKLSASGNKPYDSLIFTSKQTMKNNFSNSLFSELVLIDGIEHEAIITQERKSEDKKILLKPDTKINIGSVVIIKELNYLIFDFLGDGIHEIYPTATLKRCNSTFPIQTNKMTIEATDANGNPIYDRFGDPVYIDSGGELIYEPCIVETKYPSSNENDQLPIPDGRIHVTMKYQEADNVKFNETFNMYNNTYKITDIDYTKVVNGVGIMTIIAENVSNKEVR